MALQCPAILTEWWLLFGFLAFLIAFALVALRWGREHIPRAALPTLVLFPLYVGIPLYFAWVSVCEPYPGYSIRFGGGGRAIGLHVPLSVEQILLSIFVLGLVLHVVAGGWFSQLVSGSRRSQSPPEPIERDGSELRRIGDAAGELADRYDGRDATENLVFSAWREMTALVDVSSPETSTPGEFADAAIGAGMAPDHVEALTRLFEDVRYGDRMTSADEERALAVLRRIEASYSTERDER